MRLEIVPINFDEACEFVLKYHRHHLPPQGYKFCLAISDGIKIVGISIVGRPTSRNLQDGWTLEVTRLCTDGTRNACSKLYSACWRVTRNLGYRKLVTYILNTEKGTSLKAANWKLIAETKGGSWSCKNRPRIDKHPLQKKFRFEIEKELKKRTLTANDLI